MTEEHCIQCTNVKLYDGKYRCMQCFKQFVVVNKEDVMNSINVAPAIERIKELENENSILKQSIEAMKAVIRAMKTPVQIHVDSRDGVSGVQHGGTG